MDVANPVTFQIAGQPLVTPREAAFRVVAMEAAYESARTRRWVSVAN